MQSNPTSNGQGSGGSSNLTAAQALTNASSGGGASAAAASNPMAAGGGGMFGANTTVTETLGARRPAGDGSGPPRKAMQLGKAKKLPNNLDIL